MVCLYKNEVRRLITDRDKVHSIKRCHTYVRMMPKSLAALTGQRMGTGSGFRQAEGKRPSPIQGSGGAREGLRGRGTAGGRLPGRTAATAALHTHRPTHKHPTPHPQLSPHKNPSLFRYILALLTPSPICPPPTRRHLGLCNGLAILGLPGRSILGRGSAAGRATVMRGDSVTSVERGREREARPSRALMVGPSGLVD